MSVSIARPDCFVGANARGYAYLLAMTGVNGIASLSLATPLMSVSE